MINPLVANLPEKRRSKEKFGEDHGSPLVGDNAPCIIIKIMEINDSRIHLSG